MLPEDRTTDVYLSKSLFIRGMQCPKSLYLHKYHPDLCDEISDSQQALFRAGFEVGKKARDLFPGGVEIPYEENNYAGQVEKTKEELDKGTKIIYEATFCHNKVFVKVDILRRTGKGWEIYEVKSSAKVEDVHINDTAVQYCVLKGAGLNIAKASVVHINNQYVRDGEIEVKKLFKVADITDEVVTRKQVIKKEINKLQKMLRGGAPDIDIGEHCSTPYDCDFRGHCWQHIPQDSVFDLRKKGINKFALYRQGIINMKDIPLNILNKGQRMQVETFLQKKEVINKKSIRTFLDTLWYPMYFLDFETFQQAIPPFDGTRPYQKIPFQYSLHVIDRKGTKPKHFEYLVEPGRDPREEIAKRLSDEIPGNACVLAYHKSFETEILKNLKEWFPKYSRKIDRIIADMKDLKEPFAKRHVYHWQMQGSASLKAVLPAMIQGMTYKGMDVSHGGEAQSAYFRMIESDNSDEIRGIRKALLEYCRLDTLAMVRILERLRGIS